MDQQGESTGCLVVVVGASGAGKDSLIKAAQKHFKHHAKVRFAQRVVTRPCNPELEVHDSVSIAEFERHLDRGDFAVHWNANELLYALRANTAQWVQAGYCVVANGSRAALPSILSAYDRVVTLHVTADASILAQRLKNRGRESEPQIRARLKRNATLASLPGTVIEIDNSAARSESIDKFIAQIEQLASTPA